MSETINKLSVSRFQEDKITLKLLNILISSAYLFGIAVRLIYIYQMNEIDALWLDGLPLAIATPDAGRYGYYAEQILSGVNLPLFKPDYITGHLIAAFVKITTLDITWVMLLLPILIAPLIVIPILLIGYTIRLPRAAFLAALISVSELAYYSRSIPGYMDTDGVNLFLILLGITFMIYALKKQKLSFILGSTLILMFFSVWYHSAAPLILVLLTTFVFTVLLTGFNKKFTYFAIILLGPVLLPVDIMYKAIIELVLYFVLQYLYQKVPLSLRVLRLVLIIGLIGFLTVIDTHHYIARALNYLNKGEGLIFHAGGTTYHYANTLNEVSELQGISLWSILRPESLSNIYVLVGTIGFISLLYFFPNLLVTAPLIFLGFASLYFGNRFAMFAGVPLAFGNVFFIYVLREYISQKVPSLYYYLRRSPYYVSSLILLLMLYNIFQYNPAPLASQAFYKKDVQALQSLTHQMDKNDTLISWWDYGWPLWYYTGINNTLVDNGAHGGPDLAAAAKILMSTDDLLTNRMARFIGENRLIAHQNGYRYVLPYLAQKENLEALFQSLKDEPRPSSKAGDTYILLHSGMLRFIHNIRKHAKDFGNMDEIDSLSFENTILLQQFSDNYSLIKGYSFIFDSNSSTLHFADNTSRPIHEVVLTKDGHPVRGFRYDNNSTNFLVLVNNLSAIYLNENAKRTFLSQALLFDKYDQEKFEKVSESQRIKIFKVLLPKQDQ